MTRQAFAIGVPVAVWDELLAIAEAAGALNARIEHSYRCEYRTATKGWKPGQPPVIECVCGLDAFDAALAALESRLSGGAL